MKKEYALAIIVVLLALAAIVILSGVGATLAGEQGGGRLDVQSSPLAKFKQAPITWNVEGDGDQIRLAYTCQNSQGQYAYNPQLTFQLQPVAYIKQFSSYVVAKNLDFPAHTFSCNDLQNYRWTWANWQPPNRALDTQYTFEIEWHVIEAGGASHIVQTEKIPFIVLAAGSTQDVSGSTAETSTGQGMIYHPPECIAGWTSCYGGVPYYCYNGLIASGGSGCQAAPTETSQPLEPPATGSGTGTADDTGNVLPATSPQPNPLPPVVPSLKEQCEAMNKEVAPPLYTYTWTGSECAKKRIESPSCTPLIQRYNEDLHGCETYYDLPTIGAIAVVLGVVGYIVMNRKQNPTRRRRRYG